MTQELVSVKEAASYLGLRPDYVMRLLRERRFKGARKRIVGTNKGPQVAWVIPTESVEAFKTEREKNTNMG